MKGRLLAVVLALVLIAPMAQARTFEKNEDSTDNDHDLEVGGGLTDSDLPNLDRYDGGYTFTQNSHDYLRSTDAELSITGDVSVLVGFEIDSMDFVDILVHAGDANVVNYEVYASEVGTDTANLNFCYSNAVGGGSCFTTTGTITPGSYALWARRDVGVSSTAMRIVVYNSTGDEIIDETDTLLTVPNAQASSRTLLGTNNPADNSGAERFSFDGELNEVRIWPSALAVGTLDLWTDPDNVGRNQQLEGTEEAAWFLERYVEPGQATGDSALILRVPVEVGENDTITVHAWNVNGTGSPILASEPPTFMISRVQPPNDGAQVVEHWNGSAWNVTPHRFTMLPVSPVANETLYRYNLTDGLPVGNFTFKAFSAVTVPSTGATLNTTDSESVQVVQMVEIESFGSGELLHMGIFGGLFLVAMWQGWVLPQAAAFLGLVDPIFGAAWPLNFATEVLFFAAMIWVHAIANGWAWADSRQQEVDTGAPTGGRARNVQRKRGSR